VTNMKTPKEVQRAHDILTAIVLGEVPVNHDGPDDHLKMMMLQTSLDTLCWVLGHQHNATFGGNIARIESQLESIGFVLKEVQ
jgi:hypothetical protein